MNKYMERIYNGIWKENPIFVQMIGLCPTLAVTTSAINGVGMGLSTTVVLVLANILIAALRKIIPDSVRLPAEIVVVATPDLYESLGIYIPLIVVNCIILGRAEAYAMKNNAVLSAFDGIGMGIGFTIALILIGAFRELIGAGMIFGVQIMPASYVPVSIFILAPGAFFILAILTAVQNKLKMPSATNGSVKKKKKAGGCSGDCLSCAGHDAAKAE